MSEVAIVRKHHRFIAYNFLISFNEKGNLLSFTGASSNNNVTMAADNKANSELIRMTIFQLTEEKNMMTKCGKDEPNVNAAINIPIAIPRFFGNHWDKIFTAIG